MALGLLGRAVPLYRGITWFHAEVDKERKCCKELQGGSICLGVVVKCFVLLQNTQGRGKLCTREMMFVCLFGFWRCLKVTQNEVPVHLQLVEIIIEVSYLYQFPVAGDLSYEQMSSLTKFLRCV